MKKLENYCSIIFLFLLATTQVKAQSVDVVIRENGTERKESIDLPKSMTYPLDSLLNDWKAKNYIDLGKDCSTAEVNPLFSDSVYIDRLSRIPAVMEMPYNDIVRKFIDMYAGRLRNHAERLQFLYAYFRRSTGRLRTSFGTEVPADYRICTESFSCVTCRCFWTVAIHDWNRKDLRS